MSVEQPTTLRDQQLLFANHLRNPSIFAAPAGVEERRLRVYRNLFFGNISQLLATAFPVIRSILPDIRWQVLVRDFYTVHRCETPLFPFIAGEFADYLLHECNIDCDYPFLAELAQYEWSEIALRHSDARLPDDASAQASIGSAKPVLSPLCWPMVFRFPVHRIGVSHLPKCAPVEPSYLLVYRQPDGQVKFVESSPATFRLLQMLQDDSLPTLQEVCDCLAAEMQAGDIGSLKVMIEDTLSRLLRLGCLFTQTGFDCK